MSSLKQEFIIIDNEFYISVSKPQYKTWKLWNYNI